MLSSLGECSYRAELHADPAVYTVAVEFENEIVEEDRVLGA
jgi:hypothetical protein